MSAQLDSLPKLRPMRAADLDRIMEIEPVIYTHPWTRGNFDDSMRVGYSCWVIDCGGIVAGYGVLMIGVKEAHLLNLGIARQWQGRGLGRSLLEHFIRIGRDSDAQQMFLEVRPSKSRPDIGVVKVRTTTLNQKNEAVQISVGNLMVPRRPT